MTGEARTDITSDELTDWADEASTAIGNISCQRLSTTSATVSETVFAIVLRASDTACISTTSGSGSASTWCSKMKIQLLNNLI